MFTDNQLDFIYSTTLSVEIFTIWELCFRYGICLYVV